ncbi:hypothetical protein BH23ACT3_BH23ACT3_23100 [soil metagenome]
MDPSRSRTDDTSSMERQASALAELDNHDEGADQWRADLVAWADAERRRLGIEPLKTETELYRRARALGLLRPVS